MALTYADRVKETTATTGTGTLSLDGAATGFQTFVAGVGSGNTCAYCITDGTDWETGIGTVTSGTPDTLSRDTILASSNGDLAVDWGSGDKDVFLTQPAEGQLVVGAPVDDVQMIVSAHSTQTANILETYDSAGALRAHVDESGRLDDDGGSSDSLNFLMGSGSLDAASTRQTVIGSGASSAAHHGTVVGSGASGDGFGDVAIGSQASALGGRAIAIGKTAKTQIGNSGSIIIGADAKSGAHNIGYGICIGRDAQFNNPNTCALGSSTYPVALMLPILAGDPLAEADRAGIYTKDVSTSAELFAIDEAGNVTQLSPHNPETGEWEYYSHNRKTGRVVRIRMEQMMRKLDAMLGGGFMDEFTEEVA